MASEKTDAQYLKSTAELDFEHRKAVEEGGETEESLRARDFSGGRKDDDLSGFVGVDPEYRNFANDVDRPLPADADSAQGFFEARHSAVSNGVHETDVDAEEEETESSKTKEKKTTPPIPSK